MVQSALGRGLLVGDGELLLAGPIGSDPFAGFAGLCCVQYS